VGLGPRLGCARCPASVAIEEERLHVHRRVGFSDRTTNGRRPPVKGRRAACRRSVGATQSDAPAARFAEIGEAIVIEAQCAHYAFDPTLTCQAAAKPARIDLVENTSDAATTRIR
jgi:hypothetical protein